MQELVSGEILFAVGAAIVLAFFGAVAIKRVGIPQTLGFMLAGIALGLVGIASEEVVNSLRLMVSLALGLIGYNIGFELKSENLGGRIRKLSVIVLFEAAAAFLVVTAVTYLITGQWHASMLFGAVASATAPAATADVVWEHETEGVLTSSLMFVLAADDIVAVVLTNTAIAYALLFYNPAVYTPLSVLLVPIYEIVGAALVGGIFAFLFTYFVKRENDRGKLLELELGLVILLIGLSIVLGISEIFASMVFGYFVSRNLDDEQEQVPALLQRIMSPIIMIFFVLVGARMAHLISMEGVLITVLITAVLYLVGRTAAKFLGANLGAAVVGEEARIRKYLGSCLFCQAGVALGLSFVIEETFFPLGGEARLLGITVLGVVAVSTIILEAVGPLAVKESLRRAGELPDGVLYEPCDVLGIYRCSIGLSECDRIREICQKCPNNPSASKSESLSESTSEVGYDETKPN